ncbi:MAG: YHYH protein [Acidobacteriota bacterium]
MRPAIRLASLTAAGLGLCLLIVSVVAQPPRLRRHTAEQARPLDLEPAYRKAPVESSVRVTEQGEVRIIHANGIPEHRVGAFPNRGNPHRISAQRYTFQVPLSPEQTGRLTALGMHDWGVAVNGVPFDPGAAEFWQGKRNSGWQYEALAGAVPLGLDANHAHVQPSGAYHYHGLPVGLLEELGFEKGRHSPLVGWAADGFPLYAALGYSDADDAQSPIKVLRSSHRLLEGNRPGGRQGPGGTYDGTFVQDYRFVEGAGDLDACNGRFGVTPEFPEGTYAYFLTEEWPVIPRCYVGTPDSSFFRRPGRPR